jgi:glycosyltransferase involved in cell wall biosynthesis
VVSDLPYCEEWFVSGENGIVVPVGSSVALAEALIMLCADGEMRARFRNNARRLVEEKANYHLCMNRLHGIYQELFTQTQTAQDRDF